MNALITELRWRGMLQDIMPGTEDQLNKEMTTGYIGFDPTADSLHVGNLDLDRERALQMPVVQPLSGACLLMLMCGWPLTVIALVPVAAATARRPRPRC